MDFCAPMIIRRGIDSEDEQLSYGVPIRDWDTNREPGPSPRTSTAGEGGAHPHLEHHPAGTCRSAPAAWPCEGPPLWR